MDPLSGIPTLGPLTKPSPGLVTRPRQNTPHGRYAAEAACAFADCVALGTHVFDWCNAGGGGEFEAAATLMYRDLLESLDAFEVLVGQGVTEAAIPVVRSMWEVELQLAYLLEEEHEARGLAYHVASLRARIRAMKARDRTTREGQAFESIWEADADASKAFPHIDMSEEIAAKEAVLGKPQFAPTNAAFEALKKKSSPWYALAGGPQNLKELTERMHRGCSYEMFYRPWSKAVHGEDALAGLLSGGGGRLVFRPFRDPHRLVDLCTHASLIFLKATIGVVRVLAPDRVSECATGYEMLLRPALLRVRNHDGFAFEMPGAETPD